MACLSISQLVGCCCDDPCASCAPEMGGRPFRQVYEGVGNACYGYHSTCWHPWPEECQTCPPPTWLPAASDTGKGPSPAITPDVPIEPLPIPANPPPQPPPDEGAPRTQPEGAPESETPKSTEPGKDPSNPVPAEPGKDSGNPAPDSPPRPEPAAPPRRLETKPPTTPRDSENVKPQNHQAELPETSSAASVRRAQAYQRMMPRPVSILMAQPVLLEGETGQDQLRVQMDQSLRSGFSNPGAPLPVSGSLQSKSNQFR